MPMDTPLDKSRMRAGGFTFRKFFVAHDRCAMKVGTDGVLLGAWAPITGVSRVLDMGTGSGLVALMLAQRLAEATVEHAWSKSLSADDDPPTAAENRDSTGAGLPMQPRVVIHGVELVQAAAAQAAENINASPWSSSMRIINQDIVAFARDVAARYDLIVSNPPYFPPGVPCGTEQRDQARYTASLDHQSLLAAAWRLLTPAGHLALVLPEAIADRIISLAAHQGLHLRARCRVSENQRKPAHRALLLFSSAPGEMTETSLVLRDNDNRYSADFRRLTGMFYLAH